MKWFGKLVVVVIVQVATKASTGLARELATMTAASGSRTSPLVTTGIGAHAVVIKLTFRVMFGSQMPVKLIKKTKSTNDETMNDHCGVNNNDNATCEIHSPMHIDRAHAVLKVGCQDGFVINVHVSLIAFGDVGARLGSHIDHGIDDTIDIG